MRVSDFEEKFFKPEWVERWKQLNLRQITHVVRSECGMFEWCMHCMPYASSCSFDGVLERFYSESGIHGGGSQNVVAEQHCFNGLDSGNIDA